MATAEDNRIARPVPSVYDGADLPRVRYLAEVASRGYVHLAFDERRGAVDPAAAAALGRGVVIRANPRDGALAAFVWLPGELACLIVAEHGTVEVEVAGPDAGPVGDALRAVCERLHRPAPPPSQVPLAFWCSSPRGGEVRVRDVDVVDPRAATTRRRWRAR